MEGTCSPAHLIWRGRPANDHQNDRLAGGGNGLEQFFLAAGKAQVHAAGGFAFHEAGGLAQGQNGHVCLLR